MGTGIGWRGWRQAAGADPTDRWCPDSQAVLQDRRGSVVAGTHALSRRTYGAGFADARGRQPRSSCARPAATGRACQVQRRRAAGEPRHWARGRLGSHASPPEGSRRHGCPPSERPLRPRRDRISAIRRVRRRGRAAASASDCAARNSPRSTRATRCSLELHGDGLSRGPDGRIAWARRALCRALFARSRSATTRSNLSQPAAMEPVP